MAERVLYDCAKCPGYCCSYPVIVVTKRDVTRMARHFGLSEAETERRYCTSKHGYKRILRRKPDTHYGRICNLFDSERRCCSIYEARPAACRAFPGRSRCAYYDFLAFERAAQDDPDYVATTWHVED